MNSKNKINNEYFKVEKEFLKLTRKVYTDIDNIIFNNQDYLIEKVREKINELIPILKNIIINNEKKLNTIWIEKINNIWYFWSIKSIWKWININWKDISNFPNTRFNIIHWIWNKKWVITNIYHLKKLFRHLWITIANEQQEKERLINIKILEKKEKNILKNKKYILKNKNFFSENKRKYKEELLKDEEKLKNIWIIKINWKFYFWDTKPVKYFPNIWKRNFSTYPSTRINIIYWIWNEKWIITNMYHIRKLFKVLWIKNLASEKEEITRWSSIIDENIKIFNEIWIEKINDYWDFSKIQNSNLLNIEINWKSLSIFPNIAFNKKYWIWSPKNWQITKISHLKQLFKKLWKNIID